jgi:Glycosyl hydrolases family 32 C terminal
MTSRKLTCVAVLTLFATVPTAMASSTWYVDGVNGSDSNDCKSRQTACQTIGYAVGRASSGDSVLVAPAIYTENLTINFNLRTIAPLVLSRPYDLKLVVDRSSIEAYAQNGTIAMTNLIFPASDTSRVALFSASGKPVVVKGDVWKLRTIWK